MPWVWLTPSRVLTRAICAPESPTASVARTTPSQEDEHGTSR